jgi:hypothetical protein
VGANPFTHPDAQRRFRVVENLEELKTALDQPFEKWAVFLHPAQRDLVEREWSGAVRISGSAGTGKTIVALHRGAHLAKPTRVFRVWDAGRGLGLRSARRRGAHSTLCKTIWLTIKS